MLGGWIRISANSISASHQPAATASHRDPDAAERQRGIVARLLRFGGAERLPANPPSRMPHLSDSSLQPALFDSWTRNNTILVNLLAAVPESGFGARAMPGSPTVGEMFMHLHYVRLVFVAEDVPECAPRLPAAEWVAEPDRDRMAALLHESAKVVADAVARRLESGQPLERHYDHPILLLQHMIWHEGYHHGQIKLALKLAGAPLSDQLAGPLTWGVWMRKTDRR